MNSSQESFEMGVEVGADPIPDRCRRTGEISLQEAIKLGLRYDFRARRVYVKGTDIVVYIQRHVGARAPLTFGQSEKREYRSTDTSLPEILDRARARGAQIGAEVRTGARGAMFHTRGEGLSIETKRMLALVRDTAKALGMKPEHLLREITHDPTAYLRYTRGENKPKAATIERIEAACREKLNASRTVR